jgi:hypothetical protein
MITRPIARILLACAISFTTAVMASTPAATQDPARNPAENTAPTDLQAAIDKLDLPGVKININEWSVDVEAEICLRKGLLELIACTRNTKEHESIVMIHAKPSHIHTALLLLGAKPGRPATIERVDDPDSGKPQFIEIPPTGHPVDVYLIFAADESKEIPINQFIIPADYHDANVEASKTEPDEKFPTNTFMFAGSLMESRWNNMPKTYVADHSGSVISLVTFSDELLCAPEIRDADNDSLTWQANHFRLPELGTKTTLRLRPQRKQPTTGDE